MEEHTYSDKEDLTALVYIFLFYCCERLETEKYCLLLLTELRLNIEIYL